MNTSRILIQLINEGTNKILKLNQRICDSLGYLFRDVIPGLDTKLANTQHGQKPHPGVICFTEEKLCASLMDKNIQVKLCVYRVIKQHR